MRRARRSTSEPVFVCGLGRSGTTWLARSLGQSPELAYVQEAWLVEKLEGLADWFAMLHDSWEGFTPWRRAGIDRAAFVARLALLYRQLLDDAAGGARFVEKTPHWNVIHLSFLHELFPDAYFLLLYRDGRNVVASLEAHRAAIRQDFDFARACKEWAAAMDVFADVRDRRRVRRFALVRYEQLRDDFDSTFAGICEFAAVPPFRPRPLLPNTAFPGAAAPDELDRRWREWPLEKRAVFARLAGPQLAAWGYAPDDSWVSSPPP
jgi:hypothetical protein